jgi:hypothetical protein
MKNIKLINSVLSALMKTSAIMIFILLLPFILFTGYIILLCNQTTIKEIEFQKNNEKVIFSSNVCGFLNSTHKLSIKLFDENNNIIEEYSSEYNSSCSSFFYKNIKDTLFIIQYKGCEFKQNQLLKKSKSIIKFIYNSNFYEENGKSSKVDRYEKFPPDKN